MVHTVLIRMYVETHLFLLFYKKNVFTNKEMDSSWGVAL